MVVLAGIAGGRSGAADLFGPLAPAAITAILLATLLLVAKGLAMARAQARRRP